MAAVARINPYVDGKSVLLAIKKTGGTDFTPIGCAEDITFKTDRDSTEYSCRSGSGTLPSGNDPTWSISLKGFYFTYAAGNVATNVSASEMLAYHRTGDIVEVKIYTNFIGDMVITGKVFIKSLELAAPQKGLFTYSVELPGTELYTIGAVA